MIGRVAAIGGLLLLVACGGRGGDGVVRIDLPTIEPDRRIAIETLQPGPSLTPTPDPTVAPDPTAGPTPTPVPAPRGVSITSAMGTQHGAVGSYCWSEVIAGPATCHEADQPRQEGTLGVAEGEEVLLRIDADIPPDDETARPFQGTRSGFPVQQIEPALTTDLTVDLPPGTWSLDLCAAWHGRGQPICWLFRLDVNGPRP